jgi:large subunit ribosomal protein L17
MRHRCHRYRVGADSEHRLSIVRGLASSLIGSGKIKTTHAKCHAIRSFVEKLVTIARNDTLANRRLVQSKLNNKEATRILFKDVAPRYKDRKGGYTRILKLADGRVGDGSKMSIIAFVD